MEIQNKYHLCDYGCGLPANYLLANGNLCCEKLTHKCPEVRRKSSEKQSIAHKEGRMRSNQLNGHRANPTVSDEIIISLIKESRSGREVVRKLNRVWGGILAKRIKRIMKEHNLNYVGKGKE